MDSQTSSESEHWIDDDEWSEAAPQTRRRLLQTAFAGIAGSVALAGCSSNGDGNSSVTPLDNEGGGGSNSNANGGDGGKNTLDHIISIAPKDARFNPYGTSANFSFRWFWGMFDQLAVHDKVANKTKGMVLKDWSYKDDGTVNWTIRDTYTWHDGSDLTAKDIVTQLKIGKLMQTVHKGYGVAPQYKNVKQTGKYTLQFEFIDPDFSHKVFEYGHLKRRAWVWAHRDIWGKFATMYDEASSKKERDQARQKLQNTTKRPVWDNAQVPGNSVWRFVEGDDTTAYFKPYKKYYSPFSEAEWANGKITGDQINYDLNWHMYENQQQRTQAMKENIIDVSYPPDSESARKTLKQKGWAPADDLTTDQIVPTMRSGAMGILFNCQSNITGDPRVRKAIYHVVPRKNLMNWVTDYNTYWIEDRYVSGIGQDKEVSWFGGRNNWPNKSLKSLEHYAHTEKDIDTKRATKLLNDAGFSKSGGRWKDPNGKKVTLQFYTATSGEEPMALRFSQIAKSYLDKFGLETEVTAQEATVRAGNTQQSGDWHLMFDNWGGAKSAPPFLDFNTSFRLQETLDGEPIANTENWAMNKKVDVPYPIGNPDGQLQTVNVINKLKQLRSQLSEKERQKRVTEVAWIFNQTLPMMHVNEEGGSGGYWMNKNQWRTRPPKNQKNPAYRYEIIEVGQYSYAQYMAKFGTEWFGMKK